MTDLPADLAKLNPHFALDPFHANEHSAWDAGALAGYAHGRAAAANCDTNDDTCKLPGDAYCGGCLEAMLGEANEKLEAARDRERALELEIAELRIIVARGRGTDFPLPIGDRGRELLAKEQEEDGDD